MIKADTSHYLAKYLIYQNELKIHYKTFGFHVKSLFH